MEVASYGSPLVGKTLLLHVTAISLRICPNLRAFPSIERSPVHTSVFLHTCPSCPSACAISAPIAVFYCWDYNTITLDIQGCRVRKQVINPIAVWWVRRKSPFRRRWEFPEGPSLSLALIIDTIKAGYSLQEEVMGCDGGSFVTSKSGLNML